MPIPLSKKFYARETTVVAKELLGMILVSEVDGVRTTGRIVETESYLPRGDPACHASKSRTPRTAVMFGQPGLAYVYPIHANVCFNIVTEAPEVGCAVLIRALEPLEGIETMQRRRGLADLKRLATGPGCLCQAMAIDRILNRHDLATGKTVWVERAIGRRNSKSTIITDTIKTTKRIGVTSAKTRLLRYCVLNNPFVSGPKNMRT